ncbi:MAG: hypothetical protein GX303_04665 [Clostridiales bacterium]|nr:hypothetical protein [Clostridiales bacterium]
MRQKNLMTAGPKSPPDPSLPVQPSQESSPVNRYYHMVSVRFKLLKLLTLLLLIIFILMTVTFYRDNITYNNLRYLLRDLDEAARSDTGEVIGTIRYDADGNRSFAIFRGNLSIAGESRVTVYKASGRQLFSKAFLGSKPVLVSSDKYLLVYDFGGYQFAVYNLLTELYRQSLDYPISGAVMADDGTFAVLTQTLEHRSAVFLYNNKFDLIGKYLKDKYVIDLALKRDGRELLLLSFYADGGDYVTEISGYTPFEPAEKYKVEYRGEFPLKAGYFGDSGFCAVGDSALRFFDNEGQNVSTYDYGSMSLISADIGESGVVAIFNKNIVGGENSAVIFDTKGNIRYNNIIGDNCVDLKFWGDYVYMLTDTEVIRISSADGTVSTTKVESGAQRLLVYDEKTFLLCYSGWTQTIRPES